MSYDLYPVVSIITPNIQDNSVLFPTLNGIKEIDLRLEMRRLLHGYGNEIAKGQRGLLRRMRLDSNNRKITCSCVDELTNEPDKDHVCPYCLGEGFLWDEEWITYYKVLVSSNEGLVRKDKLEKGGIVNIPYAFFYLEYHVNPTRYDKIVEVERSLEGTITRPYTRTVVHDAGTAQPFRSDNGRVEYWRIAVVKRSIQSTWQR